MDFANARHRCGQLCACPACDRLLVYWPAGDDHACTDPECRYAHGLKVVGNRSGRESETGNE